MQKILYLFVNVNCKQMIMICLCYYHTGVIITSEPITERLTHNHICVHDQINITTEIIWKRVRNYSLFNIAQTGKT